MDERREGLGQEHDLWRTRRERRRGEDAKRCRDKAIAEEVDRKAPQSERTHEETATDRKRRREEREIKNERLRPRAKRLDARGRERNPGNGWFAAGSN